MDQKAILADYQLLRRRGIALNETLIRSLSKEDITVAGQRLGVLEGGQLVFETEDEVAVILDYALHEVCRDGGNAIARMLRDSPPAEGSIELRLLHSLKASRYTLVEVLQTIPGFGLHGLEGAARTPVTLVDVGFSKSAKPRLSIATRLQSPGVGWSMTTGASLPLTPKALDGLLAAMIAYERRHGHEPPEADRATMVVRECLKAGASHRVRFASPDEDAQTGSIRRSAPKVGRNDRCPCGSGKKYKKCCGA